MAFPEGKRAKNFKDRTGLRYGRLVVIRAVHRRKPSGKKIVDWLCLCDCGVEKVNTGYDLESRKSQSCGCYRREVTIGRCTTHGASQTAEFRVWVAMIDRCERPDDKSYKNYGARGIKVCDRWRTSFESFLADMGLRPEKSLTLERVDNNGHYEPMNCRWAPRTAQGRNKRNNSLSLEIACEARRLYYEGGNISAMARGLGLSVSTLGKAARGQTWTG